MHGLPGSCTEQGKLRHVKTNFITPRNKGQLTVTAAGIETIETVP